MRNYSGFALLTCVVATSACSAGGVKPSSNVGSNSSAGSGSIILGGSGGSGSFMLGNAGGPALHIPGAGAGSVDVDPGNPNITHALCGGATCPDFPAQPIMGMGAPANAPTLFGAADNFTPGLCAIEPQLSTPDGKPGAMLPANWLRPRFRVMAPAGAGIDLLEIRLHSPAEKNDLVAYTPYKLNANGSAPSWYLPKEVWTGTPNAMSPASGAGFANNAAGQPVTVTIRGINSSMPGMKPIGVTGDFNIAPVVATGSMVFWTVNSASVTKDSSKLLGFAVGDEGVANALTLADVKWTGQIGEDGGALRGFYDNPPLLDFPNGTVRCVGCHATIPDGSGVVFTDDWPWAKAAASLTMGLVGTLPAGIGAGAVSIMKMPWWGQQSMSPAHWATGDKILITSYGSTFKSGTQRTLPWNKLPAYGPPTTANDVVKFHQLAWINMESTALIDTTTPPAYGPVTDMRNTAAAAAKGTGWGLIGTGDSDVSDVSPSFSHLAATDRIVYTTTDFSPDGHPDWLSTTADIRTVAYNNKAGGISAPLMGASDPAFLEYYPSYSADDKLIAFTRAPAKSATAPDGPYYNRFGQAAVVPAAGAAMPSLLAANDPVTCAGDNVATGIINSWPKWSPDVFSVGGKSYYFLVFSSGRKYADEFSAQFPLPSNALASFKGLPLSSQLYLAAVVVDNTTGAITSYPAVYIWNQNRTPGAGGNAASLTYSNLTPAWDPITLPPLVIPEVPSDIIPK